MDESKRRFIKGAVAAGSLAVFTVGSVDPIEGLLFPQYKFKEPIPTELDRGQILVSGIPVATGRQKFVATLCQSCNTRCGIRVRVVDGRAVKIDGNPYHPNTMRWEPIDYATPAADSIVRKGVICLKGQEGMHWTYDPYRIRTPLKRAGPRGAGKWKPIGWDQLITEVTLGGQIFKELGEDRVVEGFAQVRSFDPIDPDNLELGPKANQLVILRGRGQPGRVEFISGWLNRVYGSINFLPHDGVCAIAVQTGHDIVTDYKVEQMRPDIKNARFLVSFGDIYSAGQPSVTPAGSIIPGRLKSKDLKMVVVDPRAGNAVAHADAWIPVKPRTDGALVMGMIRWVIENKRYNEKYLENPNQRAAEADGEPTWTDSTHLVVVDSNHKNYRKKLRGDELGLTAEKDKFVVIDPGTGKPQLFDQTDKGTLFFDGEVLDKDAKPIKVKSSLLLLKDEAFSKTLQQWGEICGVQASTIASLSNEFTSYGRRVGLLMYRAPATQYNGTYMVMASLMLQMLIGTFNYKGGYLRATGIGWTTGRYDLTKFGSASAKGVRISREKYAYENTSEYQRKIGAGQNPYPAKLSWFPLTHGGLWTEALAGIDQGYPYKAKIVIEYFANPIYSLPAGHKFIETFKDPNKVPLHIAIDNFISETSSLADYIVPDLTWLEGNMGIMNPYPPNHTPWMGVRVPAVEPLTDRTPDAVPIDAEAFFIDVAKKMKLPGVGENVIPGSDGKGYSLNRAEDYHIRAIVNLAYQAKVPDASDADILYVEENYPSSYISYAKKILSSEEWRKFAYVIARGGYFEKPALGFDGEIHKYGLKMLLQFYSEKLASTKHAITGEYFKGTATWLPAQDMKGRDLDQLDRDYPMVMVGYKMGQHTQSRTMYQKWALELYPENYVEISEEDASEMKLQTGDIVKLESASDSTQGKVKVTKRIRPGVIAIAHHYGHWQWGSTDATIEKAVDSMASPEKVKGNLVEGDPSRGRGIWGNKLMRVDDTTKAPLVEAISGCSPTSGVRVRLSKI